MEDAERAATPPSEPTVLPVHPTGAEIMRWRMVLVLVARVGAILLAMLAFWPFLSWIIEGVTDGDLLELGYYADRIILGLFLGAAAIVGFFTPRLLARWLVPIPRRPVCPGCGFDLSGLRGRLCAECGMDVMAAGPGLPESGPSYGRWHAAAILLLRAAALLMLATGAVGAVNWFIMMMWYSDPSYGMNPPSLAVSLLGPLVQIVPGPVVWVFAPRLARLALRGAAPWPNGQPGP